MSDIYARLGRTIYKARIRQCLSQYALASRARVARMTVVRIERGEPISAKSLEQIAAAVGLTVELCEANGQRLG